MNIEYGNNGVNITLTGNEVATAIRSYLVARNVHVSGPSTVTVNDELCLCAGIFVDPSGFVVNDGYKYKSRHSLNK